MKCWIGCGTGVSITLAEQGAKVLGIDVHLESLEVARSKIYNLNIDFLELSAVDIDSLEKNLIQLFYMTLEHLTLEERLVTLDKCKNVLKKGGYLIIIEAPKALVFWLTQQSPFSMSLMI